MKELKLTDFVVIIVSVLMLLPILIYAYGTLIFGGGYFDGEQKFIAGSMAIIWVCFFPLYFVFND